MSLCTEKCAMPIWPLKLPFAHSLASASIYSRGTQMCAMMTSIRCGAAARPCPKAACTPRCSAGACRQPERQELVPSSLKSSSCALEPHLERGSSRRQQLLAAAAAGALLLLQQPASAAEVPKGATVGLLVNVNHVQTTHASTCPALSTEQTTELQPTPPPSVLPCALQPTRTLPASW